MRKLDQYSLGAFLRLRGLSPEAIEMLGVTWGYETSLNTAMTEILREEHETVAGDYHEIIGGMDRLPEAFAERLNNFPFLQQGVTPSPIALRQQHLGNTEQRHVPMGTPGHRR